MRLAEISALLLLHAPAFGQTPDKAPPEGFYRDIPDAYDLLLRPSDQARQAEIAAPCGLRIEGPLTPEKQQAARKEIMACGMDRLRDQRERADLLPQPETTLVPLSTGAPCVFPSRAKTRAELKVDFDAYEACMFDWIKRRAAPPP